MVSCFVLNFHLIDEFMPIFRSLSFDFGVCNFCCPRISMWFWAGPYVVGHLFEVTGGKPKRMKQDLIPQIWGYDHGGNLYNAQTGRVLKNCLLSVWDDIRITNHRSWLAISGALSYPYPTSIGLSNFICQLPFRKIPGCLFLACARVFLFFSTKLDNLHFGHIL